MWIVTILTTAMYASSVYLNWKYTSVIYSVTKGKHPYSATTSDLTTEMTLMFVPVINTIGAVRWLLEWPYRKPLWKWDFNVRKFFKLEEE